MTEQEAITKVCHASVSFDPGNGDAPRCCGASCMAWRWSEEKRSAAFLEAVQAKMMTQAKPNFNTATQEVYSETGGKFARTDGGCGLAGAVQ